MQQGVPLFTEKLTAIYPFYDKYFVNILKNANTGVEIEVILTLLCTQNNSLLFLLTII